MAAARRHVPCDVTPTLPACSLRQTQPFNKQGGTVRGPMTTHIEPYDSNQLDAIVQLSLRAWAPVFDSLQKVFDSDLYQVFYPDSWSASQQQAVEAVCTAEDSHVWVALDNDSPVGFVAVKLHEADLMGEVYMVAVDPDQQGRGIGSALIAFALDWMKGAGMAIAMVETGGDPGHAPARHTYEKMGFGLFPVARYFKKL
ncbi:MAG TPA: GNAT family N-acetyltransferase [Roseiflexaceae bacterium]|nr:GNAT family N-acetyltransferase [Roseiflexaceae bacterium]